LMSGFKNNDSRLDLKPRLLGHYPLCTYSTALDSSSSTVILTVLRWILTVVHCVSAVVRWAPVVHCVLAVV
jgi:hypothetical protein